MVGCPGWRDSSVVHRFVGLMGGGTRGGRRKELDVMAGIVWRDDFGIVVKKWLISARTCCTWESSYLFLYFFFCLRGGVAAGPPELMLP